MPSDKKYTPDEAVDFCNMMLAPHNKEINEFFARMWAGKGACVMDDGTTSFTVDFFEMWVAIMVSVHAGLILTHPRGSWLASAISFLRA